MKRIAVFVYGVVCYGIFLASTAMIPPVSAATTVGRSRNDPNINAIKLSGKAKSKPQLAGTSAPIREPIRAKPVEAETRQAENRYEPVASDGSFGRQKGNLRLPVRGSVAGRFGSPREGGGTWRGLFIKAGIGSEVKAVANGRVVFAEWIAQNFSLKISAPII